MAAGARTQQAAGELKKNGWAAAAAGAGHLCGQVCRQRQGVLGLLPEVSAESDPEEEAPALSLAQPFSRRGRVRLARQSGGGTRSTRLGCSSSTM